MKSIKPGRGPSMMSGIVGIFMIGFGVVWTAFALQVSGIVALFGVLWTGIAVVTTVYNFKNVTGKNRYSEYDITDANEEPDPLNERFGAPSSTETPKDEVENKFCPYCGTPLSGDFEYCNKCGKKLP